jgi:hypothetical protein
MTGKETYIGQTGRHAHASASVTLLTNGSLKVSLGSVVRPGLYSNITIPEAYKLTNRELMRCVGEAVVDMASHQFRMYGDPHDVSACITAAVEATHKLIKDGTPKVWYNRRHYGPLKQGTIRTLDIPNPVRPNWK